MSGGTALSGLLWANALAQTEDVVFAVALHCVPSADFGAFLYADIF